MPSPFPGMDPYLEDADIWPGLHHHMISEMSSALNAVLPAEYVAKVEERYYVETRNKVIVPDVGIRVVSEDIAPYGQTARRRGEPIIISASEEPERDASIQIVSTINQAKIIVEIELLSPTNKRAYSVGRECYLEKQRSVLKSWAHLVEIDLLRSGEHTVACPQTLLRQHGAWDYLVCIHPALNLLNYKVWMIGVRENLPTLKIPLEKPNEEVALDLQAVLNQCYDACAFAKQIKYIKPPEPPLNGEDAVWAEELLKSRNL